VGQRYPQIQRHLFDLEGVVKLAAGSPNLHLHGGDFRACPLPPGMDLITLIRVVHDHDDDVIRALFRDIRAICSRQTTLMIAEPFAGRASTARVTDAYFNMYFAAMGQGRTRSPKEIAALAAQAGFGRLKVWSTNMPLVTGLLTLHPL
jgi:demethylspheroidene O-methyltransferase